VVETGTVHGAAEEKKPMSDERLTADETITRLEQRLAYAMKCISGFDQTRDKAWRDIRDLKQQLAAKDAEIAELKREPIIVDRTLINATQAENKKLRGAIEDFARRGYAPAMHYVRTALNADDGKDK
jgi:chromosome segregation ATPase